MLDRIRFELSLQGVAYNVGELLLSENDNPSKIVTVIRENVIREIDVIYKITD